jgi:RHS repeat-associated protein
MVNPTGYPQVVEESTLSNNVPILSKVYSHGVSLISERRITGGTVSFYGCDGLGSTRFLTDGTANITDTYAYDAFGNEIASTGSTANNYLYAGQQWDPDLGHYFLRARYYNPNTGRFLTLDTYEGDQEEPLSLHKYIYGQHDPADNTDPSGMFTQAQGYLAEAAIQAVYASDHSTDVVSYGKWTR